MHKWLLASRDVWMAAMLVCVTAIVALACSQPGSMNTPVPRPSATPLAVPASLQCDISWFTDEIVALSEDQDVQVLKIYSGAVELERSDAMLRCDANVRVTKGDYSHITYYYEIDRDGDVFIGYELGFVSKPTPTPVSASNTTPVPRATPIPTPAPYATTVPIVEYTGDTAALVALYQATGGAGWEYKDNWLSVSVPLDEWYGVTTDLEGRVIGVSLHDNNLRGEIPPQLGKLSKLQILYLSSNHLTGTVPSELSNLSNLESLYLNENLLTGKIPSGLGDLPNLKWLGFAGDNQFVGCIPDELRYVWTDDLEELELQFCTVAAASTIDRDALVALYHALRGMSWENNTNWLDESVPLEEWYGVTTAVEGRVVKLLLGENGLGGWIPREVGTLVGTPSELEVLDLSGYRSDVGASLGGEIPPELGNLSNLKVLNLYKNSLSGRYRQN